ncbi:MAG: outer membrane protein assembly factor BamD [Candidatus Omnitrophica bacterium]|nr:outer membrane protein assembly factor BamD [Candidatus Omnitrophota bacterium]
MRKKSILTIFIIILFLLSFENSAYGFWLWTPKSGTLVNPKYAVKDSPQDQFDWAMRFFKLNDFKRSADEFMRLTKYYPDSDLAPDAQYYAGRSYEELGKYYAAFINYQKTIDNYPYTRRMNEIIRREYNIANIFQTTEVHKVLDMELSLALDRAITVYNKIVENAPFGEYADKSLYKMAECYRRAKKYKKALEAYERLMSDYPESDLVTEARYQFAYTKYEASLDPEYDQESTEEALREFQQIAKTTAIPAVAEEAEKVFDELKEKKAESEFKIAKFYERGGKYKSALIYYNEIVGKFPGTKAGEEAAERITYLKEKVKGK